MTWSQDWINPQLGYTRNVASNRDTFKMKLNSVGFPNTYGFDAITGNTNHPGRWSWKLADNLDNNDAICYAWYSKQPSALYINAIKTNTRSDCPCLYAQAILDRRLRFSSSTTSMVCFSQRNTFTFIGTSVSFHTACCYSRFDLSLINTLIPELGIATQMHISQQFSWFLILASRYHRQVSRSQAVIDDKNAFSSCCEQSSLCYLYTEKRPVPTCSRYVPPIMGELKFYHILPRNPHLDIK